MKGISDQLKNTVAREVMIKNAIDTAKLHAKTKRPITRSSIEDILADRQLNELTGELS